MTDDQVIVIGTSLPKDRPQHMADLLDCLSYPEGCIARFSYRVLWIDETLLELEIGKDGSPGILVFCDLPETEGEDFKCFIPFRNVRLLGFEPHEVVQQKLYDKDTIITLRLRLGSFITVSPKEVAAQFDNWNRLLKTGPRRPFPREYKGEGEATFVYKSSLLEVPISSGQDVSWQLLADRLAQTNGLRDAKISRVASVARLARNGAHAPLCVKRDKRLNQEAFLVDSMGQYAIRVTWHKSCRGEPKIECSSKSAHLTGPILNSFGQHTEGTVFLRVDRVYEYEAAVVSLMMPATEGVDQIVKLVFLLKPNAWLLTIAVVFIAVGSFLTGCDKEAIREFCGNTVGAGTHFNGIAVLESQEPCGGRTGIASAFCWLDDFGLKALNNYVASVFDQKNMGGSRENTKGDPNICVWARSQRITVKLDTDSQKTDPEARYSWISEFSGTIALLLKAVGAFLVGVGAYIGFRRFPV